MSNWTIPFFLNLCYNRIIMRCKRRQSVQRIREVVKINTKYIKPKRAWKKLSAAYEIMQPVYICGATGFGKTELVKRFLGKKKYEYISCNDDTDITADKLLNGKSIAVIDDIHMLSDEEKQRELIALLKSGKIWVVMLCRSKIPSWLMECCIELGLMIISENDLKLSEVDMYGYFSDMDIGLSPDEVSTICQRCMGNALILRYCAAMLAEGAKTGSEFCSEVTEHFCEYLNTKIIPFWSNDVTDFLMKISVADEFTLPMAEAVTGNPYAASVLKCAVESGNFIFQDNGVYRIREPLLTALRERAVQTFGSEQYNRFLYSAGMYYEANGQDGLALEAYKKCGSNENIRDLLIRNAQKHMGVGYYFEMRKYYFQLDEADIEKNVILMTAMSMLYSFMLDEEKSEYWYGKLKEYSKKAVGAEKKAAASRLVYLDIGLPHRGSAGVLEVMKSVPALLFDKGIGLPEFSVTSNMPSTMNGGKDFCNWSLKDRELARFMGKLVERILGSYGKGLVSAALGESLYEKAEDNYEVLSLLSKAQIDSEMGGKLEITFAAVGLQVRMLALEGSIDSAAGILNSFEKRVTDENNYKLLPNIRALRCRLDLLTGNASDVKKWHEKAPDENVEFNALERYRYLTKIRCYIAFGEYTPAFALIEKLKHYGEKCGRTYILMELGILTAILKKRFGGEWQEDFLRTLKTACKYKFVRIISEEGAAAAELLENIKDRCAAEADIDDYWFERVFTEAKRVAVFYPSYLKGQRTTAADFSKLDLDILRMQADGYSVTEIAKMLEMNSRTVKYHVHENYKKLGVSVKAEAILTARNLKLL